MCIVIFVSQRNHIIILFFSGKLRPAVQEEVDLLKSTYLDLCIKDQQPLGSLKVYEQMVIAFKNRMYSKCFL